MNKNANLSKQNRNCCAQIYSGSCGVPTAKMLEGVKSSNKVVTFQLSKQQNVDIFCNVESSSRSRLNYLNDIYNTHNVR
jgi:hypothetical protein